MNANKPYLMTRTPLTGSIQIVAIVLLFFSIIVLSVNGLVYEFPGNNYLFYKPVSSLVVLFLSFTALTHQLGVPVINKEAAVEYFIYIGFIMLLTFSANAIQYTPFEPIDRHIIALEQWLHLNGPAYITWLHQHAILHQHFEYIYPMINLELLALPVAGILLKKYDYLYEYYFLMLISVSLGYAFYYFFPTTGPASMFHLPYFTEEQLATGLKFQQIHHYTQPSTMAGGMIAMPSYHVIWCCLTAYFARFQPILCAIVVIINTLIILSCVLLGWHYVLDIIGSFITVGLALWIKNLHGFAEQRVA